MTNSPPPESQPSPASERHQPAAVRRERAFEEALATSAKIEADTRDELTWKMFRRRASIGHIEPRWIEHPWAEGGEALVYAMSHHLPPNVPIWLFDPGPALLPIAIRQRLSLYDARDQVLWALHEEVETLN
jgi:hypothetical protein